MADQASHIPAVAIRRIVIFGLGAGLATLLVVIAAWDPAHGPSPLPGCALRSTTGWLCPGCGGTTATRQLLHGELAKAWVANPLLTILLPLVGLVAVAWAGHGLGWWLRPWPAPSERVTWILVAAAVLGILLYGVARNLWP